MTQAAEEVNRMGLENIVVGLRKLLEGKDMMIKARKLKDKEEKFTKGDGPEEAIKEALQDYATQFTGNNTLVGAVDRAVLEVTHQLITVEGIEMNFAGVSIKVPSEPVEDFYEEPTRPVPVRRNPNQQNLNEEV